MPKNVMVPLGLILLLLFLLFFCWGNYYIIKKDTDFLITYTDRLQNSINNNAWQEAHELYQDTEKKWEEMLNYWPILIHHQEVDRIEESLVKLKSYIQYQENSHALAELLTLVQLIQHIPQKEILILKNIF